MRLLWKLIYKEQFCGLEQWLGLVGHKNGVAGLFSENNKKIKIK